MPEKYKVKPAEGWPVEAGEVRVADHRGPVAVVVLSSESLSEKIIHMSGVSIVGPLKTENIGVEKVVSNVISNPNIRFLLLCGAEVTGHMPGATLKALYENGVQPDRRVKGAPGAIPYVEHLTDEAVSRFQRQIKLIDMINVEDLGVIESKIAELVSSDPGALHEPPMIVKVEEEEKAEEVGMPLVASVKPALPLLESSVNDVADRIQMIEKAEVSASVMEFEKILRVVFGAVLAVAVCSALLVLI